MSTTVPLHPSLPILMVDDEEAILASYDIALRLEGYNNIVRCVDSREAMKVLEEGSFSLVLLDLIMPFVSGQTLLTHIKQQYPGVPVIVITANETLESVVDCMREGAFDYVVKPIKQNRLITTISKALEFSELHTVNQKLQESLLSSKLKYPEIFSDVIANNASMHAIFQYIEAVGNTNQPVLITGETGVGKELMAEALHRASGRTGSLVAVNASGLDDQAFSDTLFGHVRGAFTGADKTRDGLVARAADGTLFLDEIGDLSETSQVRLLRFIQEGEYYPLGSDVPQASAARLVVATHRDLEALHQAGKFRKDLFYRLKTHRINVPPLRDRLDDIPILFQHFLKRAANELGKKVPTVPKELFSLLQSYHYPGNVRELYAMVYDAMAQHKAMMLSMAVFNRHIFAADDELQDVAAESEFTNIVFPAKLPTWKHAKRLLTEEALKRSNGNKGVAATMLGVTRQALAQRQAK